jgi:hypothetical protein
MLDDVGAPRRAAPRAPAGRRRRLPAAFAHPDFVFPNVVCDADRDGALVFVDWSGAGLAPRAWPLAFRPGGRWLSAGRRELTDAERARAGFAA